MTNRIILFYLAFLGIIGISHAQKQAGHCGFDANRDTDQEINIQQFEEQLRQFMAEKVAKKGGLALPYTVPVVVHIIHDGGPENISDARVLAAIQHLNEGFAAQGRYGEMGATVNSQIQFCMAKRDPDGHATKGITRTQSALTNMIMETQDIALKDLSRWNPTDYVNIWVVNEITSNSSGPGVAGYAYFPSSHGGPRDGMVCEARYFGTTPADDAVLVHEMGHYFGLYHTFEGGCKNDDCTVNGDRVCDTPPDQATHSNCTYNSCNTDVAPGSPFVTDVNDFTGDFMDYSPFSCYHFFTNGQAKRMVATIESARKSLLLSKGCTDPCTIPITAAFSAMPNPVFAGQSVSFNNSSTGASQYSWAVDGVEFSKLKDPTRVFNTLGINTITLVIKNTDPNCEASATLDIVVKCPIKADFTADKTEIDPGETISFTNSSTGGANQYEWSINGFPVASTLNHAQLFNNPGYYTVALTASGALCSDEKTVLIYVKSKCDGLLAVENSYTVGQQSSVQNYDMLTLPDGSSIVVGTSNQRPMIYRVDKQGVVLWEKIMNQTGNFNDLEPLPNGNIVVRGRKDNQLSLAIISPAGNFISYRTLQSADGFTYAESFANNLAANPDGSFGFTFRGNNDTKSFVGKISATGQLLWLNQYSSLASVGGIRVATDGSGDFLLTAPDGTTGGISSIILRIGQSGNIKRLHRYALPQINLVGMQHPFLAVHPDGDFSMLYHGFTTNTFFFGDIFVIRCRPDGQPRFAKRITTTGTSNISRVGARHFPGNGWIINDGKDGADLYMLRLDEQGNPLWTRKIGVGSIVGDLLNPMSLQNGIIRGIKTLADARSFRLLQVPDAYLPINCLPDVPKTPKSEVVQVSKSDFTMTVTARVLNFMDEDQVLSPDRLSRTALCSMNTPCPEACDNQLDDDNDGLVDCFDTDCSCFDTDTTCTVKPPANNFAAKLAWQSTSNDASISSVPMIGNLDPQRDSIPEIIVIPSSNAVSTVNDSRLLIFKGDGSNANAPQVLNLPASVEAYPGVHPTIADLDKNGVPELIVVTVDARIRVFTNYNPSANPCMTQWMVSTQPVANGNTRAYVADFDADGVPEIFSGNDVFSLNFSNPAAPFMTKTLDGTGARGLLYWSGSSQPAESSTAADLLTPTDCNGDPDCDGLELACGYQIYSIDLSNTDGDGFQIKVQRDLRTITANNSYSDGYTSVADLNLDGTPEIIVSGVRGNSGGFYAWNKNGLVQMFTHPTLGSVTGMVCVANVFDDRNAGFAQDFPELIACEALSLVCLNLQKAQSTPATPWWWNLVTTDASGLTGATVFDFNGDGLSEIVYRDERDLRIMYGGPAPFPPGVDVERNWFKATAGSGTFDEYPVVADVDNDGEAEIAVTSYLFSGNNTPPANYKGRLRIFESANAPWLPARPLWNQYNYFNLNINDDLSVPKTQQKHWLELGGPGSGKRPFNTHLAQAQTLNPLTINKIKTPDISIVIDSTRCGKDSFDLFLHLCNMGSAAQTAQTPTAFYLGNPTIVNAPLIFPPLIFPKILEKGACEQWHVRVPAQYNQTIFVVANDDGSLARPFTLDKNFPSTSQQECQYTNNMASFSIQHQQPPLALGADIVLCQNSVKTLKANTGFQQYRWQDGSSDSTFTAYLPGKYWVDAFDVCGLKQTDTIQISLNPLAKLELPDEISLCEGSSLDLKASGFAKYSWAPADSLNCADCSDVTIKARKSVTVFLTAANGDCFVTDSVRLNIHPVPVVNFLTVNGDCVQPSRIVPVASGAAPFSFLWSNATKDSVLSTYKSGTYTLEITDAYGCVYIDSATVTSSNSLQISTQSTQPKCAAQANGRIDISMSNGTAPFSYKWSTNDNTEDLSNLKAGIYTVTVSDINGCSTTLQETLTDPPALQTALKKTDPKCAGEATGSIDLSAGGGTGSLTYKWSNNAAAEDISSTKSGIYTVTVSDVNGCSTTLQETLTDPPALQTALKKTDPKCAGEATGSIDLSASGGTGSLTYKWSNNAATKDISSTKSGIYTVTISDVNGCSATLQETLTDPPALQTALKKTDPKCAGEATGSIDLSASGGTGNLTYKWSNNAATKDINSTKSGIYIVTVSDINGCSTTLQETLTDPPALQTALKKTDPKCAGEATGSIDLSASGGSGNLTYKWSNNAATEDVSSTKSGIYTVTVSDINGCSTTLQETLTDPPALQTALKKTDPKCAGEATGSIDLSASGGTGSLTYKWSNNAATEDVSSTKSGIYTVTISDVNGCSTTLQETLTDPPALQTALKKTDPKCAGEATGSIELSASGGTGNLTYKWSNNAATKDINSTKSGIYTVTVSDMNGCTMVMSETLIEPAVLVANPEKQDIDCMGQEALAKVVVTGGIAPYRYKWSDGSTENEIKPLLPSVYTVTITDANECLLTQTISIAVLGEAPVLSLHTDTLTCAHPTGQIEVLSNQSNTQFQWSGPDGFASTLATVQVVRSGSYTVTATSMTGACTTSATLVVAEDIQPPLAIIAEDKLRIPCSANSLTINATGSSSGSDYALQWTSSNGTGILTGANTNSVTVAAAGMYQLTVKHLRNGCSAADQVLVEAAEPPTAIQTKLVPVRCFGEMNGSIQVLGVLGGTAPFMYSIQNQPFTSSTDFNNLPAGPYTIIVKDKEACTLQANVIINEAPDFSVSLSGDALVPYSGIAQLQANIQPAGFVPASISWTPSNLIANPNSLQQELNLTKTTLFGIKIENENGCTDTAQWLVRVERERHLYAPNVFRPGSSNNDFFTLFGDAGVQGIRFLRIYDRWGELIYERHNFPHSDPEQAWDGTYNGSPMSPQVLVWVAELIFNDGTTLSLSGDLTILK